MISAATAGHYPNLDVTGSYTHGFSGSYGALGLHGFAASPFKSAYGASVNLWWTLLDFGRTSAQVEAAEARRDGAGAQLSLVIWMVQLEVTLTFHECVRTRQVHAASVSLVRERQQRVDLVLGQSESGTRSNLDLELARADLARAKADERTLDADAAVCVLHLAANMGRNPDLEPLPIPGENVSLGLIDYKDPNILQRALEYRPDLKLLRARIDEAKAMRSRVTSGHFPEIRASASVGYARVNEDFNPFSPDDPPFYSAGVGLHLPLFEGFRLYHESDAWGARIRAYQAQERAHINRVTAEVRTAIEHLKASRIRFQLAEEGLPAAKRAFELAKGQYEAGITSALNLFTAETALWNAHRDVAEARAALGKALAHFEHVTGSDFAPLTAPVEHSRD
jgi:outer membrane protein TolC